MLISFSIVSAAKQVSEAKIPTNFLESLDDDDDFLKTTGYDSQPDSSVSVQKKLVNTDDIADDAITSPKIKDGEVNKADLNPNAVKLVINDRLAEQKLVLAHSTGGSTAECNSNEVVTGGGFVFFGGRAIENVKTGNGWKVTVQNDDSDPQRLDVVAECAHLELGP